ncbi:MAG: type IX secretion system membrane protein PorP/SprF [Bacteroidales bacterium]|jgi:type IX secretion system PorP/SprF family membrane protein|nr:type IX secretion system membrane protein PorP/SprF [Bacteroidales bacterium]
MKIKLKILVMLLIVHNVTFAQTDVFYTHNFVNNTSLNPAFMGSSDKMIVMAGMRSQWVGMDGAPRYSTASANVPFSLFNVNQGFGFNVVQDKFGVNTNIAFSGAWAVHLPLKGLGNLGVGVGFGYVNNKLNKNELKPDSDGDPLLTANGDEVSNAVFDLGFGVHYYTDKMYVGLSATNLLGHKLSGFNTAAKAPRMFHLSAGYDIELPNPKWVATPSVFLSTNITTSNMNVGCTFEYNKLFWLGVNYKVADAISGMAGIVLLKDIKIGYSYDYTMSKLSKANSGSHELMIVYGFNLRKEKAPKNYRSIRFL